jgi:hypothetical protein
MCEHGVLNKKVGEKMSLCKTCQFRHFCYGGDGYAQECGLWVWGEKIKQIKIFLFSFL